MTDFDISVTEVRNALRCPRIFVLGRTRRDTVAFPVGASTLGAVFHRIVERFSRALDTPPPALDALGAGVAQERIAQELSSWLLALLMDLLEEEPAYWTMPAEVDDLAEALRELADYMAQLVAESSAPPARTLGALLQHAELPLERSVTGPNGLVLRITGRADAVFRRARGTYDVVEYKLTDPADDALDRAQVALYRYLLAGEVDAEPIILRFSPTLRITRLPPEEADALVLLKLVPLVRAMAGWLETPGEAPPTQRPDLCAACPLRDPCVAQYPAALAPRDVPPAGAAGPTLAPGGSLVERMASKTALAPAPPVEDAAGREEAVFVKGRIVEELRRRGVMAEVLHEPAVGPNVILVEMTVPRGRIQGLDIAQQDVCHRLDAVDGLHVRYRREGPKRLFAVARIRRRPVDLAELLARAEPWLSARPGRFVLGEQVDGSVLCGDFGDGGACHLLIGGQTGSGKSVLLRALLASLAQFQPPSAVRFSLVDPKRITFNASFRASIAGHLDGAILYDVEGVLPKLETLADDMEERYAKFERIGDAQKLDEYNAAVRPEQRLARHILVVDEFQDLLVAKGVSAAFLSGVKRLGSKARAAGIHLVLATQRPDKDTVPGALKANLVGRVALRVQSPVNSRIILGSGGAEALFGDGDLLADLGHGIVRAQAPMA